MDILEKELFELQNENYELPDNVLNKINTAFDEIRNTTNNNENEVEKMNINNNSKSHKKIIGTAAALALITGLSFTPPVKAGIKDIFLALQNKGVDTAIENDYVQKVSKAELSTDDFDINLVNILSDPSKIAFDFEISFDESFNISLDRLKESFINFDMCVSDENDNIIFKDGVSGPASTIEYVVDDTHIKNHKINIQVLMTSSDSSIPNASKYKIEIPKLSFRKMGYTDIIYSKDISWNFSVDISEKLTSSESIDYKFTNDCPNIIVNKAQALPTGMFLDFDYLPEGHYENLGFYSTLIDSEGNEYHLNEANMSDAAGGIGNNISGIFEGLTSFNNTESFTLRIQNPDGVTIDEVKFTK